MSRRGRPHTIVELRSFFADDDDDDDVWHAHLAASATADLELGDVTSSESKGDAEIEADADGEAESSPLLRSADPMGTQDASPIDNDSGVIARKIVAHACAAFEHTPDLFLAGFIFSRIYFAGFIFSNLSVHADGERWGLDRIGG